MSSRTLRAIPLPAVLAMFVTLAVPSANGQNPGRGDDDKRRGPTPFEQIKSIEEQARQIGPWEYEAQIITDAHHNIFRRNGWNSEPDLFTLDLINQVTQIAPWEVAEREEVFLNGLQNRYALTHDQRALTLREMRTESIKVAIKHFKDMVPIALEIAQTRARQEPFTAEQVQRWSAKFEPVMDDALQAVERVRQKLEKTMDARQRRQLEIDMQAVVKRHKDLVKMIKDWRAGNWNPTDWGLDNDPIHAGAMAEYRIRQAEIQGLVDAALLKKKPDMEAIATDESAWHRYVKWFCNTYKCDDLQRTSAKGILKDSLKLAHDYLNARGREIARAEHLAEHAEGEPERALHAAEARRLREPLRDYFRSMCDRLEKRVLTTEQQRLLRDAKTAESRKKTATEEIAAKS